jgi:hypothetical protein
VTRGVTHHVVALSGGKDSTAMALRLKDVEPRAYIYVCTPTGRELDEMFEWWNRLGFMLGSQIKPVMEMSFDDCVEKNQMLPNFRARFCTRQIKIEPYIRFLTRLTATGDVVSYVGLRADEEGRAGGAYNDIPGVSMRFPFREWGWGLGDVLDYLEQNSITVPERTDCDTCFHQQIGEWWRLWANHKDRWAKGEAEEARFGHTYRSPGRDSWPISMKDLRIKFEAGFVPKGANQPALLRSTMAAGGCRVCAL